MAADNTIFRLVRGASEEQFISVTMDASLSTMKHTSDPMTRYELRALLQQQGLNDTAIEACIEEACQHPV